MLPFSFKHSVLVNVSIATNRHHDNDNSHKRKHLFGAGLPVQRDNPLLLWREAWQYTGRHGTGGRSESSLSASLGSRKRESATGPGLSI